MIHDFDIKKYNLLKIELLYNDLNIRINNFLDCYYVNPDIYFLRYITSPLTIRSRRCATIVNIRKKIDLICKNCGILLCV